MKPLAIEELNRIYKEAEDADKDTFAEFRSNLLLVAGDHYSKNTAKYFNRLREASQLTENQKLRITKNHTHRIVRIYENSILSKAPDVSVAPHNPMEMQDKKEAELNKAVWQWGKNRYRIKEKIGRWVSDYARIGEVALKLSWDPNEGDLIGYEPKNIGFNPDGTEAFEMDAMGQMLPDMDKPIFSGDFVWETIPGFNLLRDPTAKEMEQARWKGIRKMVPKDELKARYASDPDKLKMLEESDDKTYIVFDSNHSGFNKTDKEVLVKEIYFKKCFDYPEGYFYIFTDAGILEQGVLPFGIFPIVWNAFDLYTTCPRGKSIVKILRPFQAEINRASSQAASHQISVGDDKILYQSGTKLAPGALLPGVRGISYQGQAPTILPGRDGAQFFQYIENQIIEMERAAMVEEVSSSEQHNLDPYSLLFRSMSQQAKFRPYIERFERFLEDVCMTFLEMAKQYLPDDTVISAIGRNEMVNLPEFRATTPLRYEIKTESTTDTADTLLGRQLTMNHLLQYVGKDLEREDIGKIIKNMPFMNTKDMFNHLTIDHDNVENDMLALERGEMPFMSPNSNNETYVKMLEHRMKQADFKYLNPQIQQNYQMLLGEHQMEIARKAEEIARAKNEYIPIGGHLVAADMYVENPEDPMKSKRVRLPYQALEWLVKQLETQGANLDKLEQMSQSNLASIANNINNPQGMGMGAGGPPMPSPMGAIS